MKKFILNFIFLLIASLGHAQNDPLNGQDSLVLELERSEYLPESQKFITQYPKINLSLPPKLPYQYSSDSFSHSPKILLPSLKVEPLQKPTVEKLYSGYARIEFSSLVQPMVLLNVNQGRNANLDWGANLEFNGIFRQYVPYANRNHLNIGGHGGWGTSNFGFQTKINFLRQQFNYFGEKFQADIDPLDSMKSHFSIFQWDNVLHHGKQNEGFYAAAPFGIDFYHDKWRENRNGEFHFRINPNLSYSVKSYRFGVESNIRTVSFKSDSLKDSRILINLKPYARVDKNQFSMRVGVLWTIADSMSFIVPDVETSYQLIPNSVNFLLGVTGDATLNSIAEVKTINPYLESNFYRQASITPWKIFAGTNLVFNQFSVLLKVYYQNTKNFMSFYSPAMDGNIENRKAQQGYFTGLYDNSTKVFGVEGTLEYKIPEKASVGTTFLYRSWRLTNYEFAFHQPNLMLNLYSKIRIRNKLEIAPELKFLGAMNFGYSGTELMRQKGVFLVNLNVSYQMKENLKIYLTGNNLLNQKYYIWNFYQELPIHGSAGFRVLF